MKRHTIHIDPHLRKNIIRDKISEDRLNAINKLKELKSIKNVEVENKTINNLLPAKNSNTAYIIGGGPSLTGFNFNNLKGDIFAINKAIEKVNKAHIFITMDYTFLIDKNKLVDRKVIFERAANTIFIANVGNPNLVQLKNGIFIDKKNKLSYDHVKYFDYTIKSIYDVHPTLGFSNNVNEFACGVNSGFCALQLAILMGYEKIYLLGFDLQAFGKITHFHNGYPERRNYQNELDKYKTHFINALSKFVNINDTNKNSIISCSKDSILNKFIKYEDLVNEPLNNPIMELKQNDITPKPSTTIITKNANTLDDLMVVGYYTVNTPYELEAVKTINSCKKFNLNYDIQGVPNLGDWQANTRFKAKFMKEMLIKHSTKRLLYIDCDAEFLNPPILFKNYSCDIAVRWQDFRWRNNECLSGTIYIEPNERTLALCDKWYDANLKEGSSKVVKSFEQWNLGTIINEMESNNGLITKNLPPEYTFIFDSMKIMYPNAIPVIQHYQASRRLKNKI